MISVAQKDQVVGLKVGRTTVAAIVLERSDGSWLKVDEMLCHHQRNPSEAVGQIWARLDHSRIRKVVATGSLGSILGGQVQSDIPRDAALNRACEYFFPPIEGVGHEPINLIRISAGGYSVLTRNQGGEYSNSLAEKCSAGTGEAVEKQCARAGMNVPEAITAAQATDRVVEFVPRCAAFAQSEITHLANAGEDIAVLLKSYFRGIAASVYALFRKNSIDGRVIVIGGVTKNQPVIDSLQSMIGQPTIEIHPEADYFEAWGAGLIAADLVVAGQVSSYTADSATVVRPKSRSIRSFKPLNTAAHLVQKLTEPDFDLAHWSGQAALGIDSGSTGTKAALIDIVTGRRVWDDYVPTNSNPVAAAQLIVRQMLAAVGDRVQIVSLGFTGSGRRAVYDVAEACFGGLRNQMLVETEITAHATGACHYDPEHGRSVTVCELGGQDAKVINIRNGVPVGSDMNRACSAGTGSEVEYDARRMNTTIQEFGRWALDSREPIDMGQTCVVFSGDIADRALGEGFTVQDIAAGRFYFIAYNWLNRLVGQLGLEEVIFALGMPVNNIALPMAIAAVTGRKVIVPPRPGATGAIGIALLTLEQCRQEQIVLDQTFDLGRFLAAEVVERSSFVCGNRECGAKCRIERTKVSIGDQTVTVKSGGMCPLHEGNTRNRLPTDAPKPFDERRKLHDALIRALPVDRAGQPTVAVPLTLANVRFMPLFSSFLANLGVNVKVLEPTTKTLKRGEEISLGKDMCAPVKVAHGLADEAVELGVDLIFFPKVVLLPRESGCDIGSTCPLVQGTPELVAAAINGVIPNDSSGSGMKILRPVIKFGLNWQTSEEVRRVFVSMGRELGRTKAESLRAFYLAVGVQRDFQEHCLAIGQRALDYAAEHRVPAVVVLGRLYATLSPAINGQIPEIIQGSGVVAIPVDCYPVDPTTPFLDLVYWGEGQRILRAVVDLHRRPGVYPLMITCYSCGPDAFLEHWLRYIADVPYCIIETDGHTGMGGFTTRIQSSVYAMRHHLREGDQRALVTDLTLLQEHDTGKPFDPNDPESALVLCQFGNLEPLLTAVYSSIGIRVIAAPPTDDRILRLGRGRYATGKECVPYMYVTGVLEHMVREVLPRYPEIKHFYWFMPATTGPCRFGSYRTQHGIILTQLDPAQAVHLFATSSDNAYDGVGKHLRLKACAAVMLADLLDELWCYYLPIARNPADVDRVYQWAMARAVEQLKVRPVAQRLPGQIRDWLCDWGLPGFLDRVVREFQSIWIDPERAANVVQGHLSGEIYVVRDPHANGNVVRILADHNVRVRRSTIHEWIQYLTWTQGHGHKRDQFNRVAVSLKALLQWWVFWRLDRVVARAIGRNTHTRIEPVMEAVKPYFEGAPEGEAALTIVDLRHGGVAVCPQGCMPSKYAQAQLHHVDDANILFLYVDGDPIDPAQLASYAWDLHERQGQGGIHSLPRK
ncbi:MAG: BadF/BadG/BcrA/BcrD ATPase family protein [Patescibacteria group bacterium]